MSKDPGPAQPGFSTSHSPVITDSTAEYIHGFTEREQERLHEQARLHGDKIHSRFDLSKALSVLEIGCGVGAQCEQLLRRYPRLTVTGVDSQAAQVKQARSHLAKFPEFKTRYSIRQMDGAALRFRRNSFDAVFICWLLEHVSLPLQILREAFRVLRPGGKIYLTEVFNSTLSIHPPSTGFKAYWENFNQAQRALGGDPDVGMRLGGLLQDAGFVRTVTWPNTFFLDKRDSETRAAMFHYWLDLMLSAAPEMLARKQTSSVIVAAMTRELKAAAKVTDSVFYYSFIQAIAEKSLP